MNLENSPEEAGRLRNSADSSLCNSPDEIVRIVDGSTVSLSRFFGWNVDTKKKKK